MAEGLLLFNRENSFLKDVDRVSKGSFHGAVMFIACACITTGIALKINQKTNHFTTTHGILGISPKFMLQQQLMYVSIYKTVDIRQNLNQDNYKGLVLFSGVLDIKMYFS